MSENLSKNRSPQTAHSPDNTTAQNSTMDDDRTPLADNPSEQQMTIEPLQPEATASKATASSPNAEEPAAPVDPTTRETTNGELASAEADGDRWEAVDLPGTVLDADDSVSVNTADTAPGSARENELLTLIHELNECNDVLLARVSQLETAVEESHQLLKSERESARTAQATLQEQASAQQASAQQISQNAQQQVANVVDQLETAEQGLQRQQLINETLLSELGNAQERVTQLEHECALSAQQHAAEAQARVKAETTIRDLRSRLQRQQRYTLQFKAALEKSLTVTARTANARVSQPTLHPTAQPIPSSHRPSSHRPSSHPSVSEPFAFASTAAQPSTSGADNAHSGVTMPKAQRIMPWAGSVTSPFEGIDPHLESLIRNAGKVQDAQVQDPRISVSSSSASLNNSARAAASVNEGPADAPLSVIDSEAETQLWQDLERVIDHAEETPSDLSSSDDKSAEMSDSVSSPASDTASDAVSNSSGVESSADAVNGANGAPKFNWRQAAPKSSPVTESSSRAGKEALGPAPTPAEASPSIQAASDIEEAPDEKVSEERASDIPSIMIDPYTVPAGQKPAAEVGFTEPSPWGPSDYLPIIDSEKTEGAPVVNPLRSQKKTGSKKINSMASVQLPTFEKAKAGSFKR